MREEYAGLSVAETRLADKYYNTIQQHPQFAERIINLCKPKEQNVCDTLNYLFSTRRRVMEAGAKRVLQEYENTATEKR